MLTRSDVVWKSFFCGVDEENKLETLFLFATDSMKLSRKLVGNLEKLKHGQSETKNASELTIEPFSQSSAKLKYHKTFFPN